MSDVSAVFGANLRRLREERGWSQQQFCIRTGYSARATLSLIEGGRRGVYLHTAVMFAEALGVRVDELLTGAYARGGTQQQNSGAFDA